MKTIRFLIELKEKGQIEIEEPSENISDSYRQKSDSYLESAKILLEKDKLEEATSLTYYSMYHLLLSLLYRCGIKSENHAASIILLKELFKEEDLAEKISHAKKERIEKEYYTDFKTTKAETEDLIQKAEDYSLDLKKVMRNLIEERITSFREELRESLEDEKRKEE